MLIININTLQPVYTLYFLDHIVLYGAQSLDPQDIVRIHTTLCQLVAGLQYRPVLNLDPGTVWDQICLGFPGLIVRYDNFSLLLGIVDIRDTGKLRDDCKTLRLSRLKELLDTGKTLCDVVTGNTSRMEGSHGKLCTRLSDRLCRDDTDSLSDLYRLSGRHVGAVAFRADTVVGLTGKDGTDLDLLQGLSLLIHTLLHDQLGALRRHHMVRLHKDIAVLVYDILTQVTSCNTLLQTLDLFIPVYERLDIHTRDLAAFIHTIYFMDDQFL